LYRTHPVVGFVLVAVGAVWVGQGLGLLRGGSFMVDDTRWAIAGAVLVVVGIVVLVRARRARPS
jgi:uncharacterized membrane protein